VHSPLRLSFRQTWGLFGVLLLGGCTSAPIPTQTIYETPHAFVRLQIDPSFRQEAGHSHPAGVSTEHIAAVLRGIMIEEPLTRLPFYDDLSIPRRHQAFTEEAVAFWAPLLRLGLSKATPEEVVTFYQSKPLAFMKREVTSGGMFMDGEKLHVVLSNYRSETSSTPDISMADNQDDRLTPLRSLAPQKGTLQFEPQEFQVRPDDDGLSALFQWDKRELIIQIDRLPVKSTAPPPSEP
jgi:hypothetical protein